LIEVQFANLQSASTLANVGLCTSDISRVAMSPLLLVATMVVVQLAAAATIAEQPSQITDEELKSINKVNDLDTKESFRCGLFFPPEVAGELPIAPLYIFNASFPAPECPTQEAERFVQFCHSIWTKILKFIVYTNPSLVQERADKGVRLGDDICRLVKEKVKAPFVGAKSRKFPRGLQVGMYTNGCGSSSWVDTGDRHPERVCCSRGKLAECP